MKLGVHLITYIHDILVTAEAESPLRDHITAVIHVLETLEVVINHPKSELTPNQEIEFQMELPGGQTTLLSGMGGTAHNFSLKNDQCLDKRVTAFKGKKQRVGLPRVITHYCKNIQTTPTVFSDAGPASREKT